MAQFLIYFQLAMLIVRLFQALSKPDATKESKQTAVVTAIDKTDKLFPKANLKGSLGLASDEDMNTLGDVIDWIGESTKK